MGSRRQSQDLDPRLQTHPQLTADRSGLEVHGRLSCREPSQMSQNGDCAEWPCAAEKAARSALKPTCFSEHPQAGPSLFSSCTLVHIYLVGHVRIFTH